MLATRPQPTPPFTASTAAADGPQLVVDFLDVQRLACILLDPLRERPVAVVSVAAGEQHPRVDVDQVAGSLDGLVPVYVVPPHLTQALHAALPERTAVFGGAARVYPVGLAWTSDPYQAPLRLTRDAAAGVRVTVQLIDDGMALAGGRSVTTPSAAQVEATGFVVGLVGASRAVARLQDGTLASVCTDQLLAGVPADQLLTPGQRVYGRLDRTDQRLDIRGMLVDPAQALAGYQPGDVVTAQVTAVDTSTLELAVLPQVRTRVPRAAVTGNELDVLSDLYTCGQVVLARVVHRAGLGLQLRLDDIEDDDVPVPAPALVHGGPAWVTWADQPAAPVGAPETLAAAAGHTVEPAPLEPAGVPAELELVEDAAEPQPAARVSEVVVSRAAEPVTASGPDLSALVADLRAQVTSLTHQLCWLDGERGRLLEQVAAQKQHLARKATATKAPHQRALNAGAQQEPPAAFEDPAQQFRFEVELEWATRIAPAQKRDLPLAPWTLGPEFLDTVAAMQGLSRRTLVRVVVEVLTGLATQMPGRDLHRLRTSEVGDAPATQRADGAICWRVALQQGTAAARRLHYWKLGEQIELSRVVVHDDMRP